MEYGQQKPECSPFPPPLPMADALLSVRILLCAAYLYYLLTTLMSLSHFRRRKRPSWRVGRILLIAYQKGRETGETRQGGKRKRKGKRSDIIVFILAGVILHDCFNWILHIAHPISVYCVFLSFRRMCSFHGPVDM